MKRALIYFASLLLVLVVIVVGGGALAFYYYGRDLPDHKQLAAYDPPVVTRLHADDGRLLAEYAIEKRVFVPLTAIPKLVIAAFLSAEDKNFYEHFGVDPISVGSALVKNLSNMGGDKRMVGASTITQQVAKNFLLTPEVSFARKIKEALLAIRIEQAYTKDRVLELYLNQIYLGDGSYGVAAAALDYFNKSLDELTVGEAAYLAALPKAPNNYHPLRNREAALTRRDWVVGQMLENSAINRIEADAAIAEPLTVQKRTETEIFRSDYFVEEARRWLMQTYGEDKLYRGGLSVQTTLDPRLQLIAERTFRNGLATYDRRHGWRGPVARLPLNDEWQSKLALQARPDGSAPEWQLAMVTRAGAREAEIGFADGKVGAIALEDLAWARRVNAELRLGPPIKKVDDALKPGDVVLVEPKGPDTPERYVLRQVPAVSGGMIAIDPHNGRVLAMVGGLSYANSEFNRATQAQRQPGSAFKPFIYLSALDHGFTPSTIIMDAPIVLSQGPGLPLWRPENYEDDFHGPSTMRYGLEHSRNLMTVRLAQAVGMEAVADTSRKFGIYDNLNHYLSASLGSAETTLIRLTTAYAMLVNGGKKIEPAVIERIQDKTGVTIYRRDTRPCEGCQASSYDGSASPALPDIREAVADPVSAYQVVSMLEGAVERGTARGVSSLDIPLAGKTGTTNDQRDAWFVGFSPDLVVGTFIGYDTPRNLGLKETGGRVSAPIFREFMAEALADKPAVPFRVPNGVRFVRVDLETGALPKPGTEKIILEAFRPGTEPSRAARSESVGGEGVTTDTPVEGGGESESPDGSVGGLY
ncbi:MAG: penicillin-binding protein 1A [Alphaproteobacteria bacterium]|nr:penicillin-binding protein 1A [Alphaproteobacteria bacterium]